MSQQTAFWIAHGLFGIAVIGALCADLLRRPRWAALLAGTFLIAGGSVSLVSAWAFEATLVKGVFIEGAAYSLVPGLAGVLAGLAVWADRTSPRSANRATLIALAVFGASVTAHAGDLLVLLLALEITAAATYALVALRRIGEAYESATKYLIQGSIATAALVVTVAVVIGTIEGGTGYVALNTGIDATTAPIVLAGAVLAVAALAFKASAAPFHAWAPDAYEVSSPVAGAVMAGPVKAAAVAALCLFASVAAGAGASEQVPLGLIGVDLYPLISVLAVASLLTGSIAALRQRSYLRMLGYAGVAQVGFALMALSVTSTSSALIAVTTYAVAGTGAFLFAHVAWLERPDWDGSIAGLAGFARRHPWMGLCVAWLMMSLAGIPPLLGFWGKLYAFRSTVLFSASYLDAGQLAMGWWYVIVTVAGMVSALFSVAYYGTVIRTIYASPAEGTEGERAPMNARAVLVAFGVLACALGVTMLFVPSTTVSRLFLM